MVAAFDIEMFAFKVELIIARPQQLQNLQPFVGIAVPFFVLHQRCAEHFHFRFIPAGHDVQRKPAAGNMVNCRALFSRDNRMNGRHVAGREQRRFAGRLGKARRPGEGLIAGPVEIDITPEATPARDGNQGIKSCLVGPGCDRFDG
jgi:hypothetical protein